MTKINFMAWRKIAFILSTLIIVGSVVSLFAKQLNWGLDFTGGTLLEVSYDESVTLGPVRDALSQAGYGDAVVQHFGSSKDVMVRLEPREGINNQKLGDKVFDVLAAQNPQVTKSRVEFVGPKVGEELANDGTLAMVTALICIMIYVAFRFEWRFALGAVGALVHDVIITLGVFSVLQLPFDLNVLAALLAVIGYSLNDTIVVSDRIRENFRKIRKGTPVEVVDISLNDTLSRTLMTSLTTLLVLVALFFLGGEQIHGFATALLIGVIVGTYSSIYVASTIALALGITKEDLMPVQVEQEGADQEPML
jgi:preprotein translocase subunit SecF